MQKYTGLSFRAVNATFGIWSAQQNGMQGYRAHVGITSNMGLTPKSAGLKCGNAYLFLRDELFGPLRPLVLSLRCTVGGFFFSRPIFLLGKPRVP